jgi:hypothetical protein
MRSRGSRLSKSADERSGGQRPARHHTERMEENYDPESVPSDPFIDLPPQTVAYPKLKLVIPHYEPLGLQHVCKRPYDFLFILGCMRDEDVVIAVGGSVLRGDICRIGCNCCDFAVLFANRRQRPQCPQTESRGTQLGRCHATPACQRRSTSGRYSGSTGALGTVVRDRRSTYALGRSGNARSCSSRAVARSHPPKALPRRCRRRYESPGRSG